MDTTVCPECGLPAEVLWRRVLESTDGPVEHASVRCVGRHCFVLPLFLLPGAAGPELPVAAAPAAATPAAATPARMASSDHAVRPGK